MQAALAELGVGLGDIVRLRILWPKHLNIAKAARAIREGGFNDLVPVMTAVVVKELIVPELVIEIEAGAIVDEARRESGKICDHG